MILTEPGSDSSEEEQDEPEEETGILRWISWAVEIPAPSDS